MDRNPVRIVKNPSNPANVAGQPIGKPVTAAWLERVALHYLDQHAASTQMLERMLARRVEKRARARNEAPETHASLIEEIVARSVRAGLIDDARFADQRLRRLRRRGTSTRKAGIALAAKGIGREIVEATLAQEREAVEANGNVEQDAAYAYAHRRRIGPHRPAERRAEYRQRDLAAMGRAGFPYPVALSVIDGPDLMLEDD